MDYTFAESSGIFFWTRSIMTVVLHRWRRCTV